MPVCPETGIGLGVPRPPVELVERSGQICAISRDNPAIDITDALTDFGMSQVAALNSICGYIFKSRSPSCGVFDTPIVMGSHKNGGTGLYTRQVISAMPTLPVTDEVLLKRKNTGNNFIERAFAFNRWQQLVESPLSTARLEMFHDLHSPELERHQAGIATRLSSHLISLENPVTESAAAIYLEKFMAALETAAISTVQTGELFEEHRLLSTAIENYTG